MHAPLLLYIDGMGVGCCQARFTAMFSLKDVVICVPDNIMSARTRWPEQTIFGCSRCAGQSFRNQVSNQGQNKHRPVKSRGRFLNGPGFVFQICGATVGALGLPASVAVMKKAGNCGPEIAEHIADAREYVPLRCDGVFRGRNLFHFRFFDFFTAHKYLQACRGGVPL